MEKQLINIIDIYSGYGFEYRSELSTNNSLVFSITQGVFENAIVLHLSERQENKKITEELLETGFQVREEKFLSLKKTEDSLFNGFFSVKKTKSNFERDYNSHIRNIVNSFPGKEVNYNYIKSPFEKNHSITTETGDIISSIHSELADCGPKLILIEAAAGFGKTCTAYEIGKKISEDNEEHIVLFAELSRDRQAKIFNHVLHKEVARSFPTVSSDLVTREIKKGKVIVILDGFDELLNEREDDKFQFEKSQAMLETISEILKDNAKIILTTRKTAILQGDEFNDWISGHTDSFRFTRYSLKEPSIRNWLSEERYQEITKCNININIKSLSNPVLLTFLRFISDEQFKETLSDPDCIVDKYFSLLLNREVERQQLKLSIEEQSEFMTRLAQYMMKTNSTRESKEEIINYISSSEINLIEKCRSRYDGENRPTFEEMIEKLSNHALLDRSGSSEKIGFINNFVLGHYVALDLINSNDEWLADSIFLEAAINAYSSRPISKRLIMWDKLKESLNYVNDDERIRLELRLLNQVTGKYKNSQLSDITFETEKFFPDSNLSSCYFNECIFKNCTFDFNTFQDCTFISCQLYDCSSVNKNLNNEFISCSMQNTPEDNFNKNKEKPITCQNEAIKNKDVKAYVLEKFWPVGKETVAFAHRPMFIFYRGSVYDSDAITDAVDELRREGVIIQANRKNWIGIDLSGTNFITIKEILGR